MASDPSGVYIGALQTENIESGLVKLSPDGKTRLWSQQLPTDGKGMTVPWEGARSLASDGRESYLLGHHAPQRVYVSDAQSGRPRRAFAVDWEPPLPNRIGGDVPDGATGMAISRGVVVIAYAARDAICWYDAATGAHLATARVPAPSGVATDCDGTVFVTTGSRAVRLTRALPSPVTIRSDLTRAGAISIDPTNGDLLIFEAGKRQQVLRLSSRGAIVRRYGLRGGRREGLYVAEDFREIYRALLRRRGRLLRRRAVHRPSSGGAFRPRRRGRSRVVRRSALGHGGRLRTWPSRGDVGGFGRGPRQITLDHARGHRLRDPLLAGSLLLLPATSPPKTR